MRDFSKGTARRARWIAGLLVLSILAAACGGDSDDGTAASSDGGATEQAGPSGTLRIALAALDSQNPEPGHYESGGQFPYMTLAFEPLFANDPKTGELQPWLATDWELEPSGNSYLITLRDDVKFQDGTPLTAEDAVYSIQRYVGMVSNLKPPLGQARLKAAIQSVDVVSDNQFRLTFNPTGSATILADLAANPGAAPGYIVPKAAVEAAGDEEFNKNPIGTGPFKFVSSDPGRSMVYEANPDYWGEKAQVENVEISLVSELPTRLAQLKAGTVDIISAVDGPAIKELQGSPDLKLVESKLATNQWIAIGGQTNDTSPLSKVEVRQALSYAIDRQGIIDTLLGGLGEPSYLYSFPASVGYPKDEAKDLQRKYDVDKAKDLLKKAGYADGFPLELEAVTAGRELANAIAQNWEEVGVDVTVNVVESGQQLADLQSEDRKQETRVVLLSTNGVPYRPELAGSYGTHLNGGTAYSQPLANPEIAKLVVDQSSESDPAKREVLLSDLLSTVFDEQAAMPVWYTSAVFGMGPRVKGWNQPEGSSYVGNVNSIQVSD